MPDQEHLLEIRNPAGDVVVAVGYDGSCEFGDAFDADEASRIFWSTLACSNRWVVFSPKERELIRAAHRDAGQGGEHESDPVFEGLWKLDLQQDCPDA